MVSRHRIKAFSGLAVWGAFFLAFAALMIFFYADRAREGSPSYVNEHKIVAWIGWSVLGLIACFFWTCYHLAKAKGYPGATCLFGVLGPPAQLAVLTALLMMQDRYSHDPSHRRHSHHRHHGRGSTMERIVICRRNAVVGIIFGLVGIAAGVFLVLFRTGLFRRHDSEIVLGIFVFLAGYAGVITGCWWWLKAKQWIDAVVFIGLMPLGVFFIPYFRLVYGLVPSLLPIGMIFMPLALMAVIYALPDKSGWADRKRWRIRHDENQPAAGPEKLAGTK